LSGYEDAVLHNNSENVYNLTVDTGVCSLNAGKQAGKVNVTVCTALQCLVYNSIFKY